MTPARSSRRTRSATALAERRTRSPSSRHETRPSRASTWRMSRSIASSSAVSTASTAYQPPHRCLYRRETRDHGVMSPDSLTDALLDRSLPFAEWTHAGHLTAAYVLTRRLGPVAALDALRTAIPAYNEAV